MVRHSEKAREKEGESKRKKYREGEREMETVRAYTKINHQSYV